MRSTTAAFASILLWASALQAGPRDALLGLVPADVGFCLVIDDLRGHGKTLVDSPFIKQFRNSSLAAKLTGAHEWQKLGLVDQFLQQYLQVTAEQLRDEVLGDALVLAYRPGPPDKPADEEGMFLLWARDPKLLAGLIERLNSIQKESGDLKELTEHSYAGRTYFTRVESSGTKYYYLHNSLFAFVSNEEALRQLIDRETKADAETVSALARQLQSLGAEKPLAALWVNPRAFDKHLEKQLAASAGRQAKALSTLLNYWHAVDGLAFTFDLKSEFELTVAVKARTQALPASARRFLDTASAPSELWRRFPEHAFFMMAGRTDVPALVDLLSEFLTEDARTSVRNAIDRSAGAIFGKDVVQEILSAIGPDWGICAAAPAAHDKNWSPQLLAAVRIQERDAARPAGLTIVNGLNTLAAIAVFHHNGGKPGSLSLKSVLQDRVEVRYLENEKDFPPGFQPAFALKGEYLVLASSPEMVRRFPEAAPSRSEPAIAAEFPLMRLSLKELCRYLSERRTVLVTLAARQHRISEEEAGKKLDGLLAILQFVDRVELTQRSNPGRAILTLRVHLSKPLK